MSMSRPPHGPSPESPEELEDIAMMDPTNSQHQGRDPRWLWPLDGSKLLVMVLLAAAMIAVGPRERPPQPAPAYPTVVSPVAQVTTPLPTPGITEIAPSPSPTASQMPPAESPTAVAATPTATVAAPLPAALTFTRPADGAVLAAGSLGEAAGTAAPGLTVRVVEGEALIGQAVADETGQWRFMLPELSLGEHTLLALAYDAAGNQIEASQPVTIMVLALKPPAFAEMAVPPLFLAGEPGAVAGTAEPGATVRVLAGEQPLGETVAGPDGRWELTLPGLEPGEYRLSVEMVLRDGRLLRGVSPLEVTVLPEEAVPVIEQPGQGDTVSARQPLFAGRAIPGSLVRILEGEAVLGEALADADGRWTFRPAVPLPVGEHIVVAIAYLGAPLQTLRGQPVTFRIEAPEVPVAAVVTDPITTAPVVLYPSAGSSVNDGQPLLTGTAAPGTTLRIYEGAAMLGNTAVDADGNWSFRPVTSLGPGWHILTIVPLNSRGQEAESRTQVRFQVVLPATAAATAGPEPPTLSSPLLSPLPNSRPTLSGRAEPAATVRVYEGETILGEVQADQQGEWRFVPEEPLAQGEHTLRLAVVASDGSEVAGPPFTILISPEAEAVEPPVIRPPLAKKLRPGDFLVGEAPPGSQVQVYDGAVFLGIAAVRADGSWLFQLPWTLPAGEHHFWALIATKGGGTLTSSEVRVVELW
jgi:hypothetical protein